MVDHLVLVEEVCAGSLEVGVGARQDVARLDLLLHDLLHGARLAQCLQVGLVQDSLRLRVLAAHVLDEVRRRVLSHAGASVLVVAKVNVDELGEVSAEQGIECMPTFIFYKNGKKVDKVEGADEKSVREMILKHK